LNSNEGALNLTLDSVFENPDLSTGWGLCNDEKPDDIPGKDNGALGHTKGVLVFYTETKTGYWLLHSWPKSAEPGAKADPTPIYGQSYLCLSLDLDTLEQIAGQLIDHQEPQTYLCRTDSLDRKSLFYKLSQGVNASVLHATHYDANDQHGSSPPPKIHALKTVPPRAGAPYRGRIMKRLSVPRKHIRLSIPPKTVGVRSRTPAKAK
jgi:Deoxyribonuclease II